MDSFKPRQTGKKIIRPMSALDTNLIGHKGHSPQKKQFPIKNGTEIVKKIFQPDLQGPQNTTKQNENTSKRVADQDKIQFSQLNRPATSKLFNPSRLKSSIDFEFYGRASPKDVNIPPTRTLRKQSVQPEPEIKSCISRSLQATPKEVLNGTHKVTQQDPTSLVIATRKQIID